MKAMQINEFGGPEVMKYQDVADPTPGEGEAVVEIQAAGVNFTDIYSRQGINPGPPLPRTIGVEGAGVVKVIGPGVAEVKVGDEVTYCTAPGTYAELALVPAWRLMKRPSGVDAKAGAAAILQGMTAHFLACSTFPLEPGHRCLIHAGAGGVGLLLIQIAKLRGAEVFTTVGSQEKAELATGAGADHVINYRDEDFGDAVERIAGPGPLTWSLTGWALTRSSEAWRSCGRGGRWPPSATPRDRCRRWRRCGCPPADRCF